MKDYETAVQGPRKISVYSVGSNLPSGPHAYAEEYGANMLSMLMPSKVAITTFHDSDNRMEKGYPRGLAPMQKHSLELQVATSNKTSLPA